MTSIIVASALDKSKEDVHSFTNILNQSIKKASAAALAEIIYLTNSFHNVREPNNVMTFQYTLYNYRHTGLIPLYGDFTFESIGGRAFKVHIDLYTGYKLVSSVFKSIEEGVDSNNIILDYDVTLYWADTMKPIEFKDKNLGYHIDWVKIKAEEALEKGIPFVIKCVHLRVRNVVKIKEIVEKEYFVKPDYYATLKDLLIEMNRCINKLHAIARLFSLVSPEIFDKRVKTTSYALFFEHEGFVRLSVDYNLSRSSNLKVKMSPQLLYLLGYTPILLPQQPWHCFEFMVAWKSTYPPNIDKLTISTLWVFADIVEGNNINNTVQNLLRVVPLEFGDRPVSYSIFGNLHLVKLNPTNINAIKIWFKEDPFSDRNLHINGEILMRLRLE